jgi:hypothetical protein
MKSDGQNNLPETVARKLLAIRRRAIGLTLVEGLVRAAAVLIMAMLAAMILDWAIGWFDPRARYTLTILALGATVAALVIWCIRPLARRRTIVATAREVDQSLPQLEERWSTVTELAQNQDTPEVRGSEAMIRKVASEAELAGSDIQPETVISAAPVLRAVRWLAGATAVLLLLLLVNFTMARLLAQRFWMPGKNISLTQVTASPSNTWVPKGEPLTLSATLKGRLPNGPTKLFIRSENGSEKTIVMSAKTGATGEFQHSIEDVSASFSYRVRSGDGQTEWQQITAVDRPKISEVKLKVTPPAYSNLAAEEKTSLPSSVRVLEGSDVEFGFRSDQPLDRFLLDFGNGLSTRLTAAEDGWYQFRTRPTNSFAFTAAAINKFQLENKNKPSSRINLYEDLAPSVNILEPSDDVAVLPGEKVEVTFEASDDLGLAKAEIIVATTKADGETNQVTIPVELGDAAGRKQLRQTVELDPKALGLKHGDQLSYIVQVTDTKQVQASADASSLPGSQSQQAAAQKPSDSPLEREQPKDSELASNSDNEAAEPAADSKPGEGEPKDSQSSTLAAQASPPQESKPANGSQPPPNEMSMRALDAGQSAACNPRNIMVDEFAGSFDGEKRQKLEMAIDPILKQLDELLAGAQSRVDPLKEPAATDGLTVAHNPALSEAKAHLGEAGRIVADLKVRTSGTPYAFIGLQVHNIAEAHISPAGKSLASIVVPAAVSANPLAPVEKASFHIGRAREMLADLTRTYETVKRDQQIADAMQKLNKMHQIFLEDTQALLGNSKGPINAYDRKIAEVEDAFVEKLRALLEEKKKIMAELAKLLAEDPRMLRRYLAMQSLQGTSYRDQMTLIAERQKQVQEQVAKWNATPEAEQPALLSSFRESYAPERQQVAQDAAKLRENMETWLPLDLTVETPEVQAALTRAEKVVLLTAQSIQPGATNAAVQALAELHALRDSIPRLSTISSTNEAKLAAYIANRLADVESLITAHSGQMKVAEAFDGGDFPKVAEVVEHRIAQDTATLGEKLDATEKQVASLSQEIAEKAAALNKIVEVDIIPPQGKSVVHLADREVKPAGEILNAIVPAFALAEQTFDELMRLIIAKLDEAPAPSAVGEAQGTDSLLSMLEDEMKAAEGLGIPCRPINVSVMRDWMKPGNGNNPGSGSGMGRAQAQAARGQAQQGKAQTERMEKQARESSRRAMAEARQASTPAAIGSDNAPERGEAWNKLASRLQKDLLQGRDNTPPEQYRAAIENYFKVIADPTATATATENR